MPRKLVVFVLGVAVILPLAPAAVAQAPVSTPMGYPDSTPMGAPSVAPSAMARAAAASVSRAAVSGGTPASILATVPAVSPLRVGYKPGMFPSLASKAKDKRGCTLRNQMLIKLATKKPRVGAGCKLTGGIWSLDFGASKTSQPAKVKLGKLMPDVYVYGQGAYLWTPQQRAAYTTTAVKAATSSKTRSKATTISPIIWLPNISNFQPVSRQGFVVLNSLLNLLISSPDPEVQLAALKSRNPLFFESWTVATILNAKAWGLSFSPKVFANFQLTIDECANNPSPSEYICSNDYAVPNEAQQFNVVAVPQIASEMAAPEPAILNSYGPPTSPVVGRDLFGIHAPADWVSDAASGYEGPTDPATIPNVPVGYVRLWDTETKWRDLEPTKGNFVWRKLQKQIETAQVLNARVMLVLGGTPAWAGGGGVTDNPTNIADWRSYVREVSCKYGPSISAYEVWNEANLDTFYSGTPAQMADLTLAAFEEIRKCNPSALVVAANTTSRATGSFGTFFPAYLAELKKRNWPADAYSVHSYPTASGGADDRIRGIGQFRAMLALSGAPFTTVFDTEVNYGLAGLGEGKVDITGDKAMALLSRTYIDSVRYGFGSTFWYAWTKTGNGVFGIQLTPGSTDEQQAWRTTYDWLIGAQLQKCASPKIDLVVCQFSRGADNFSLVWYGDVSSPANLISPSRYFGNLGSKCQTLRGSDCAGILAGTAPLSYMPVRIFGPATAAASVPAKITMDKSVMSVSPAESQPVTITVLDASGNPISGQQVDLIATGDTRFGLGAGSSTPVTNEKGQLVVTITTIGSATGTITAVPVNGQAGLKATATISSYRLGELGPGGGLVFLIANGKTYEMASRPRNAAVPNGKCISIDVDPNCFLPDPEASWCNNARSALPGTGTEVGTGRANTALMLKGCTSGAGQLAADHVSGGKKDWFLPALEELDAIGSYVNTCPSGCVFHERFDFNYTKSMESSYWSSSQDADIRPTLAWGVNFRYPTASLLFLVQFQKDSARRVRPIRAF